LHQFAYDMTVDMIDGYMKLGKTTALECLEYYCACIIECFGVQFLHRPTVAATLRLLAKAEERCAVCFQKRYGLWMLNSCVFCSWASENEGIPWWYEYPINPIKPWVRISHEMSFNVNGHEHHIDTISPMVYILFDQCSWRLCLFHNKRSINSSQQSNQRWEKI
jgi:hypothetical protein